LSGSFFTHFLLAGLRGAADEGDGEVSLGEAYSYAYSRTVERTGTTQAGTQHPAYDFRLQGKGDLTLTNLDRAASQLTLVDSIKGTVTIIGLPGREPIAELDKVAGAALTLALPAGTYLVRVSNAMGVREARIGLAEGARLRLKDFSAREVEQAQAKGARANELPMPLRNAEVYLEGLALRESPAIAGLASAVIPGAGQAFLGDWKRGGLYLGSYVLMAGGAFGLAAVDGSAAGAWGGTMWTGPTVPGMAALAIWGASIADAGRPTTSSPRPRPTTGFVLGYGTGWSASGDSGGSVDTSGFSIEYASDPGFSVGLDRSGVVRRPSGDLEVTVAGRVVTAMEWEKFRPGAFLSLGFSAGPSEDGGPSLRPVVGAGTLCRTYVTRRYFIDVDARVQKDERTPELILGGGVGIHLGG
ncbi:MAG: hypothetical protein QGG40_07480, partial [Myxococcota bacterium]|nr:hypothetical protein [Myxococcota bacterium]